MDRVESVSRSTAWVAAPTFPDFSNSFCRLSGRGRRRLVGLCVSLSPRSAKDW